MIFSLLVIFCILSFSLVIPQLCEIFSHFLFAPLSATIFNSFPLFPRVCSIPLMSVLRILTFFLVPCHGCDLFYFRIVNSFCPSVWSVTCLVFSTRYGTLERCLSNFPISIMSASRVFSSVFTTFSIISLLILVSRVAKVSCVLSISLDTVCLP